MHKKLISAMVRISYLFFLMTFLFACRKDIKITTAKEEEELTQGFAPGNENGGNSCYNYYPLVPHADGTLTGYVENVPIQISGIITQAYDNNGNPIVYQQGDPFWGQISITSSTPAEVLYNSATPQDDQFVIRIYEMGLKVDIAAYSAAFVTFLQGQNQAQVSGTLAQYLLNNSMPRITDYVSNSSGNYHDVAGRMIRIDPTQVQSGTDASGNPIFVTTTFAFAPTCYPRPGVRAGTTAASIIPWNTVGCTVPSSVDLLQNGIVIRTINFPTTYQTTGAAVNVPSGSYYLRFTIPAGYPELSFRIMNTSNYWETGSSVTTYTTPGAVSFSAGTSYTIREAAMYE